MKTSEEKFDHIVHRMQTDRSVDAPLSAIKYSKDLFKGKLTLARPSLLRRIAAVMNIDLASNRPAFGERSGSDDKVRQILFDAEEYAIDMRIKESENGFSLRGQVLGYGFENGSVELVSSSGSKTEKLDEFSEFDIIGLAAGEYSLVVRGSHSEIFVEKFSL